VRYASFWPNSPPPARITYCQSTSTALSFLRGLPEHICNCEAIRRRCVNSTRKDIPSSSRKPPELDHVSVIPLLALIHFSRQPPAIMCHLHRLIRQTVDVSNQHRSAHLTTSSSASHPGCSPLYKSTSTPRALNSSSACSPHYALESLIVFEDITATLVENDLSPASVTPQLDNKHYHALQIFSPYSLPSHSQISNFDVLDLFVEIFIANRSACLSCPGTLVLLAAQIVPHAIRRCSALDIPGMPTVT